MNAVNKELLKLLIAKDATKLVLSTQEMQMLYAFQEVSNRRKVDPNFKLSKEFMRETIQQFIDWVCEIIQEEAKEAMDYAENVMEQMGLNKDGKIDTTPLRDAEYERAKEALMKSLNSDLFSKKDDTDPTLRFKKKDMK